jgi:choline monooxygenase
MSSYSLIIHKTQYEQSNQRHLVGYADKGSECLDLPEEHIDYEKDISAYYFWFFSNFMFNFYPFGIQINIVRPISPNFTKVEFLYYIKDREIWNRMSGGQFGDEGVHHFHLLLKQYLNR